MNDLVVAALFLVGTHIGISATPLRSELIERIGLGRYRALYSLVAIVAMVWLVLAYRSAPYLQLWQAGPGAHLLALVAMPAALLLLVTSLLQPNPTAIGQEIDPDAPEPARGMVRVTRHPMMWGIAIWAFVHIMANPHLASLLFFGTLAVLALGGAAALDHRLTKARRPGWGVFVQRTSYLPFGAILEGRQQLVWNEIGWSRLAVALALYVALLLAHPWLFGVSALIR